MYADAMPAPFLSLITSDCIAKGIDYNEGGARYNTSYIQGVGIGTVTDSLAAIRTAVFEERTAPMGDLLDALAGDFEGSSRLRQRLLNRAPKWGNDDARPTGSCRHVFDAFVDAIDGRPNVRGGTYDVDMLPTTCHVYFGRLTGATPDGRRRRHAAVRGDLARPGRGPPRPDRGPSLGVEDGPGADLRHVAQHEVEPGLIEGDEGIAKLAALCAPTSGSAATTSSSTWSAWRPCARRRRTRTRTAT